MSSKSTKKNLSSGIIVKDTSSASANVPESSKKRQIILWPEFNETDINNEKWELVGKPKPEKQAKGAAVVPTQAQNFFDDPEGKCELPLCLKVASWKRPKEFLNDTVPVIVDAEEGIHSFDLMSSNGIVQQSELMRWITSQIMALWHQSEVKKILEDNEGSPTPSVLDPNNVQESLYTHQWRPWEHIYAMTKVGKGPNWPLYNPSGRYVVKLYWMGTWRKLIVDDTMPFDEEENLLLPSTARSHELWPLLLTKGLLKIAALDSGSGRTSSEYGDFSPVHCLRGWLPEIIPLEYEYMEKTWNLLKVILPEFKLPEIPPPAEDGKIDESADKEKVLASPANVGKEKLPTEKGDGKTGGRDSKLTKGALKNKKDKVEKEDKEKITAGKQQPRINETKGKVLPEEKPMVEEPSVLERPEVMIFVSYHGLPKHPTKITMLSEMADASERLRQHGLSHSYPHPVLITETRSCPLSRPAPPAKTEAWKEVRYYKKKQPVTISSEPIESVPEKSIKSIHMVSPYLNRDVTPIEIPADVCRPAAELERHSTQTSPPNMDAIAENEEQPSDGRDSKAQGRRESKGQKKRPSSRLSETGVKQEKPEKSDKQEGKQRKSRPDAQKEPASRESASSPQSPRVTEKRATSSRLSKRDSVKRNEKDKLGPKMSISNKPGEGVSATNADQSAADEAQADSEAKQETSELKTDFWMDFDVMFKCFKTMYIYHKPSTYPYNYPDSKVPIQSAPAAEKVDKAKTEKKSQQVVNVVLASPVEDKSSNLNNFLFVDSLQPSEIVVSFTAISYWNESNQSSGSKDEAKVTLPSIPVPTHSVVKSAKEKGERDSKSGDMLVTAESFVNGEQTVQVAGAVVESPPKGPLQPGLIYAETYSWKRAVAGETRLRFRTTGTRACLLNLPPGRHVLRFFMSSPLGHHVQLCSTTNFLFGDEDKVMAELIKESCRFTDSAVKGLLALGRCIQHFNDVEKREVAKREHLACSCLYGREKAIPSMKEHYKAYLEALYVVLKTVFSSPEAMNLLTPEMSFAWRVFNFDCTTSNPLNIPVTNATSRPATALTTSERGSSVGIPKKPSSKKITATAQLAAAQVVEVIGPVASKIELWKSKEITAEEQHAAVLIQKTWRGYYVRKVKNARIPGTEINSKVHDQLMKAWSALEQNLEANALLLFRTMLRLNPALVNKYSFSEDEWNRIAYADYSGIYPEHGPNSWFLIFRDVFHVSEEMLCVPKLNASIPYCSMRVINNDTWEEIPQVVFKVIPHVYKKNKAGYTFLVETTTYNDSIPAGRWRMRLIGSHNPLPSPARKEVNMSFNVQELREYYVPADQNTIFRYAVKVYDDHLVTLQMSTSKPDLYIRLQILDNDEEIARAEGKGSAVIPAFIFRRTVPSDSTHVDEVRRSSRSSSRSSMRAGAKSPSATGFQSSSHRGIPSAGRISFSSKYSGIAGDASLLDLSKETAVTTNKYIIKATALRNGWPLSPAQWAFVQSLKDNERNETTETNEINEPVSTSEIKDRTTSPVKSEKLTAKTKAAKSKSGKDKEKDREKISVPVTPHFDVTKPHWTLRIVSDGNSPEGIEVKKDTERVDAIKAMKKAWEEAEPGRAAKAQQSRLQYLSTHLVKADYADEVDQQDSPTDDESQLTTLPPIKKRPTEFVPPLDLTPWIRQTTDQPRSLEDILPERELERRQEIEAFQVQRREVEEWRERDCQWRNKAKVDQLALFERRQIERDEYRAKLHEARQSIRQQYLEKERQLKELLAAKEGALQAEKEPEDPKASKSKKKEKEKSKSPSPKKKK